MHIAFLGTGSMGRPMALRLLADGHRVTVWNRTWTHAIPVVDAGAEAAESPADAVRDADAAVTMLRDGAAVSSVLFGHDGVTHGAHPGLLVIDASTVGPQQARETARELGEAGLRYVEAPVFGTVGPAAAGTLATALAGAADDVEQAAAIVTSWASTVYRTGGPGSANALKVIANTALGVAIAGVRDALVLADALGIERGQLLDVLASGPYGFTVGQKRALIEARDFSEATFSVSLLAKDLGLAGVAAEAAGATDLPVIAAARDLALRALTDDRDNEDYAAIVEV